MSFADFVWREGKRVSGAGDELCPSPTSCGKRGRGRAGLTGDEAVLTDRGRDSEAAWKQAGWCVKGAPQVVGECHAL